LVMNQIHDAGLYESYIPGQKKIIPYKVTATYPNGTVLLHEDTYAFPPLITDFDSHLMADGSHLHIYQRLGAHLVEINGIHGVHFAVWAPNAQRVSVVGDFNNWDGRRHPMRFLPEIGVWELFIPLLTEGDIYKYEIKTHYHGYMVTK